MPDDVTTEAPETTTMPEGGEWLAESMNDKGDEAEPAAPEEEPEVTPDDETKEVEFTPEEEIPGDEDAEEDNTGDEEELDEDTGDEPEGISRELLAEAIKAGLSLDDIDALGTDAAVRTGIGLSAAKAAAKAEGGTDAPAVEGFEPVDVEMYDLSSVTADDYDEGVVSHLNGLNDHWKAQVDKVTKAASEQTSRVMDSLADFASYVQDTRLEDAAERLGEDWHETIGVRGTRSDDQWGNFDKIADKAKSILRDAAGKKDGRMPSIDEAMALAANIAFRQNVEKKALKKASKKASARKGNKLRKPGTVKTESLSEEQQAIRDIEEWQGTLKAKQDAEQGGFPLD